MGISESVTGEVENDPNWYKAIQTIIFTVCFIYPISLLRKMAGLRYISFVSFLCILYLTLMLFFEFPEYKKEYYNSADVNLF